MVSLEARRRKNIKELTSWLREQFPKIVDRLRRSETWDDITENEQYELVGRVVYGRLKSHIERNFMWSHTTVYNYTRTVMFQIGCVFSSVSGSVVLNYRKKTLYKYDAKF